MSDKAIDRPLYIKHSYKRNHIGEDAHAIKPSNYLVIGAYYSDMTSLKVCVEDEENQTFVITLTQEENKGCSYGLWNISPCNEEEVNKCTLEPLDWEGACITLLERDREDINNHLFTCSFYSNWTIHKDAWVDIV